MSRKLIALLLALAAIAVALPVSASAAGKLPPAVADCNAHARLTSHYTAAQLRSSLNSMPADIKEYTNCYDVIQKALLAQIGSIGGNGGDSGGGGSSFLPTPLLIVLGILVVGAIGFGIVALRQRSKSSSSSGTEPDPGSQPPGGA
jgi:hypothetical protein